MRNLIQRDEIFLNLEQSVFLQLNELSKEQDKIFNIKEEYSNPNQIKFISFEDAIKELSNFKKTHKLI